MKQLTFVLGILFFVSCTKTETQTTTSNPVVSQPTNPTTPTIFTKNYLQTSYEL